MRHHVAGISRRGFLLAAAAIPGVRAAAQRPAEKERDDRLGEMREIARTFKATAIDERGERAPAELARDPLHRWTDPTRENGDGALWAWKSTGRPVAVFAIEYYPHDKVFGTVWALEFCSIATGPLEVQGSTRQERSYPDLPLAGPDGRLRWAPPKAGVEFREIPGAPAPAAGEAERMRQIRDLTRRFSAREYYNKTEQHYALRLLSRPIDRYADPRAGVLDGALFLFANGTNPEVLLMIEARRRGDGPAAWSYAAAPLTRAEPVLRLDDRDVWSAPFKEVLDTGDPYFVWRVPGKPPGP